MIVAIGAFAALLTSILGALAAQVIYCENAYELTLTPSTQPRILVAMARDGLLPGWFAHIHPKFGTPANATWAVMLFSGTLALVADIDLLADLVSIGTLMAFTST